MNAPTDVERINAMPRLGGLYAQALARQAQTVLARSRGSNALPALTYEVAGVRVDPHHLNAYQHLLGERAADTLPAGFVHVVGFPLAVAVMARPDFPLPLLGMVHIANHVTQSRALRLGSELTVRAWARDLRAHRRGTQVELVVEVGDGSPAWRGISTYLARGVRIPGLPQAHETPRQEEDQVPTASWKLPGSIGREYAKVSGDVNPIHTSRLGAKALGFPRPIAHGMYTASRALAEVGPRRGDAYTWTVDFGAPVYLPGTVSVAIRDRGTTGAPDFTYRGWGKKLNFTGTVRPA